MHTTGDKMKPLTVCMDWLAPRHTDRGGMQTSSQLRNSTDCHGQQAPTTQNPHMTMCNPAGALGVADGGGLLSAAVCSVAQLPVYSWTRADASSAHTHLAQDSHRRRKLGPTACSQQHTSKRASLTHICRLGSDPQQKLNLSHTL